MTTNLIEEQTISNNSEMSKINDKSTEKTDTSSDEVSKETKQPTETVKKQVKKKKETPVCNICQEKLTKETYIRCPTCKQFFCKFCIEDWLLRMRRNRICPLCAKKWDDNFICNNLPLGFVVNQLGLRVYGLYSVDYEFETRNEPNNDDIPKENDHNPEESREESREENREESREESREENRGENQGRRESILDFIINTTDLNADQETINLIRGLLLSDLFGH